MLGAQTDFDCVFVCKPNSYTKPYERLAFWQANDGMPGLKDAVGMAATHQ